MNRVKWTPCVVPIIVLVQAYLLPIVLSVHDAHARSPDDCKRKACVNPRPNSCFAPVPFRCQTVCEKVQKYGCMVAEDALCSSYDEWKKDSPPLFTGSLVFQLLLGLLAVECRPDVRQRRGCISVMNAEIEECILGASPNTPRMTTLGASIASQ